MSEPESKIESWTQSRACRLFVALLVGGAMTAVIALAWRAIGDVIDPSVCDPQLTDKMRDSIQKLKRGSSPYSFVLVSARTPLLI